MWERRDGPGFTKIDVLLKYFLGGVPGVGRSEWVVPVSNISFLKVLWIGGFYRGAQTHYSTKILTQFGVTRLPQRTAELKRVRILSEQMFSVLGVCRTEEEIMSICFMSDV